MRRLLPVLLAAALLIVAVPAGAQTAEDAVRRIASQVQCPVCQGQTVADSASGLAGDMRAVIRQRLSEGATDREILDGFVASYGDSILVEPPKHGFALGLWVGPVIMFTVGMALLAWLASAWRRRRRNHDERSPMVPVESTVAEELRRYREGYGT